MSLCRLLTDHNSFFQNRSFEVKRSNIGHTSVYAGLFLIDPSVISLIQPIFFCLFPEFWLIHTQVHMCCIYMPTYTVILLLKGIN